MGSLFSPPQMPAVPPPPPVPPAAIPASFGNPAVQQAGASQMARAAAGFGAGTIATSPQGALAAPSIAKPALLGQTTPGGI